MRKFFCLIYFIYLFIQAETLWIGEEYWTIIDHGGNLRNGRSTNDFIRFQGFEVDKFVAYWYTVALNNFDYSRTNFRIINQDDKQFEAYGEAYLKDGRVCARFIDENDLPTEICGGFRVLSNGLNDNSNPFEWYPIRDVPVERTVEYVHHQIAQVWHDDHRQSVFGGAHINRGLAYAVNLNGTSLHIIRDSDPYFYESNVELLVIRDGYSPKLIAHAEKKRCRHRHGPIVTPDDLPPFNAQNPLYPANPSNPNECQSTLYDLNGDGYIDSQELHACRYGRVGCSIQIYDANRDGFLDAEELEDCKRVLQSDKFVRYCQDLYFDLDRNGFVDSFELESCLNRHDPSRRRNLRSLKLRKKRKEQFKEEIKNNEANESNEEDKEEERDELL